MGSLPVNVRPKTSSLEGTSSLGVVVFTIERAEGSMPGSFAIASSCDCMLYWRCHCAVDLEGISARKAQRHDRVARARRCLAMAVRRFRKLDNRGLFMFDFEL